VKGLHIIADLYGCRNREMLASSPKLREACVAACKEVGLTVLGDHFYQFEGLDATQVGGATDAVVFAESHLAIHTWPERDGATLDVSSQRDLRQQRQGGEALRDDRASLGPTTSSSSAAGAAGPP
jgi:S-adenosylmethionine/arginine decarboxylase-like enzyme